MPRRQHRTRVQVPFFGVRLENRLAVSIGNGSSKFLLRQISKECATSCASAGSQLVILADDGTIYWPIADTTPSNGQNLKLLPFTGDKVTASGKIYKRGGSKAIVIEKIEPQAAQK